MNIKTIEMVAGRIGKSGRESFNSATGTAHPGRPHPSSQNRETASTQDVIEHHLKCFGEGDLKGVLSDYAPEAVMFTSNGPLIGVAAIQPLFETMIAEFAKPGAAFHMKQQFTQGDHAYILWSAETSDNVYELGTDTFVVKNGKIVAQSYTRMITPKG